MTKAILNIGIPNRVAQDPRSPPVADALDALDTIRAYGLDTARAHYSDGTLVVEVADPSDNMEFKVWAVANALGREAIAGVYEGHGDGFIEGPNPGAYLPFNPSKFRLFSEALT